MEKEEEEIKNENFGKSKIEKKMNEIFCFCFVIRSPLEQKKRKNN